MKGKNIRFVAGILLIVSMALVGASSVFGATAHTHATKKKLTIAFIQIGISANPFWADQARGAAEAGRRMGFKVENISGNQKIADQVQRMNDAIDQHVSAIAIIPVDPSSIVPALKRAQKAHIPTLVLYSVAPHATMISGFDEYASGQMVGKYAVKVMKSRLGKVAGELAVLKGQLGQTLDKTRTGGFTDVMKHYRGVQIVSEQPTDWTADKAVSIMQDWLVRYPALKVVYGLSDTITVPAINVADRSPTGKNILFFSIDGDPIGIQAIQQGKLQATALYGPIYAGFRFMELAHNLALHKHMRHVSYLKGALVTTRNVKAALRMENAMSQHITTFNFNQSLNQALKHY